MRRVLALAVVVAAVAVAWLVVRGVRGGAQGADRPVERAPSVADRARELARPPTNDVARARAPVEREVAPSDSTADAVRCDVEIVLVPARRGDDPRTSVWCSDELGRALEATRVDDWTHAVRGVRPGRYRAAASASGHRRARVDFEVRAGARALRVELALRAQPHAREVLVRAQTEDGAPFVPALATAWTGFDRGWLAIRRADGRLTAVTKMPDRKWGNALAEHVGGRRPGAPRDAIALVPFGDDAERVQLVLDEQVVCVADVPAGVDEVVLRVPLAAVVGGIGSLRGRVVAEEGGAPIEHYHAHLGGDRGHGRYRGGTRGDSPGMGIFSFASVMPGCTELRLEAGGAQRVLRVDVPAAAELDLGDVAMPSGCPFRVRVVDAAGAPLDARCTWMAGEHDVLSAFVANERVVDAAGRVDYAVGPVEHGVLVASANGRGTQAIELAPCGLRGAEIVVQLAPGTAVALDVGVEATTETVRVSTASGLLLGEHAVGPTGLVALELAPGEYVAQRTIAEPGTAFRVGTVPVVVTVE